MDTWKVADRWSEICELRVKAGDAYRPATRAPIGRRRIKFTVAIGGSQKDFCNNIGTKRQFVAPQQSGRFRSKADMRRCHGRIARGTHDPGCAVAPSVSGAHRSIADDGEPL
jgi:hypothetical protein